MCKRWFRDWSLQKKMTLLLAALVLLPCILLSFFLYHFLSQQQYTQHIRQHEALLSVTEQSVAQNFAQIESVLEVLSYSDSVKRLLSEQKNKSDTIAALLFDTQDEVSRSEAYLSQYRAEIIFLSPSEDILERNMMFVKQSRYADDEDVAQLLKSTYKALWGRPKINPQPENWLYSKFADIVVPYYIKIHSGVSDNIGLAQCSVRMRSLFLPVWDLSDKGVTRVWFGERCLLRIEQDGTVTAGATEGSEEPAPGYVRISSGHNRNNYQITLDVSKGDLRLEWGGLLLSVTSIPLFAYLLMLAVTRILVRSTLSRLRLAVDAMASINVSGRNRPIPDMGRDEVGSIILSFNQLLNRLDQQYEELLRQEHDMRRLQASALQFQMNPHFLFNSLHWLQLMMEERSGSNAVSEAVANLGDVYRYNLSSRRSATLDEEFSHITSYTSYMQAMKENTITLSIHCPEQYSESQVPRFTLQPIVENAIRHGMIKGRQLTIEVTVQMEDGKLSILVRNDGEMIDAARLLSLQEGLTSSSLSDTVGDSIGLNNLMLRLRLLYGQEAGMRISSSPTDTRVTLEIPLKADSEALGQTKVGAQP